MGKKWYLKIGTLYFILWEDNATHQLGTGFLYSDCVPYITLKDRWCDIIVVNVHVPSEDKGGDIKEGFYEEIDRLFDQLSVYDMKIMFLLTPGQRKPSDCLRIPLCVP